MWRRVKALTASQGLNKHLPGLERPQRGHEIDACQEEALRFDHTTPAQQHSHPPLRGKKEGLALLKLGRLSKYRRRCRRGLVEGNRDGTNSVNQELLM